MLVAVNMTLRLIARYIAVRFFVCRSFEESGRMGLYVHTYLTTVSTFTRLNAIIWLNTTRKISKTLMLSIRQEYGTAALSFFIFMFKYYPLIVKICYACCSKYDFAVNCPLHCCAFFCLPVI